MIQLDTVRIKLLLHDLKSYNKGSFEEELKRKDGYIIKNQLILDKSIYVPGINSIVIDLINKEVLLTISSLILKNDYYKMINYNTLEDVEKSINKSNVIKLKKGSLRHAYVLSCDCTKDILLEKDPEDLIHALQTYKYNLKYKSEDYYDSDLTPSGVEFKTTAKTNKIRLVCYHKLNELNQNKDKKKELLRYMTPEQLADQFNNVIRLELNIKSFQHLRDLFNVAKEDCDYIKGSYYVKLIDVLNSKSNPIHSIYQKILKGYKEDSIGHSQAKRLSLSQKERQDGMRMLIVQCNHDLELIRNSIKGYVGKKNLSREVNRYRSESIKMKREDKQGNYYLRLLKDLECLIIKG